MPYVLVLKKSFEYFFDKNFQIFASAIYGREEEREERSKKEKKKSIAVKKEANKAR